MLKDSKIKDRIILIIEFLSFWFALPELLGENTLRSMETSLENLILGLSMGAKNTESVENFQKATIPINLTFWENLGIFVWFGLIIVIIYLFVRLFVDPITEETKKALGKNATFSPAPWWIVIIAVVSRMFLNVAPSWLRALADDSLLRQRSLWLAAILFSSAFLWKFVFTFQKPEAAEVPTHKMQDKKSEELSSHKRKKRNK